MAKRPLLFRLVRFSLAGLMVLALCVCLVSASLGRAWRQVSLEQQAVSALKNAGAQIEMESLDEQPWYSPRGLLARCGVAGAGQTPVSIDWSPIADDSDWQFFQDLSSITQLSLDGEDVNDACMNHLANMPELRHLELTNTSVTGTGLAQLPQRRQLQFLSLKNTATIADDAAEVLRQMTDLHDLSLESTAFTDDGLRKLTELKNLRSLSLSGTKVTDSGITPLLELSKLRELELDSTRVTEAGVFKLWSTLTNLEMTAGINSHIESAQEFKTVDWLYFGKFFSDRALECFLPRAESLQSLMLTGPGFTDNGLTAVHHAKKLRSLTIESPLLSTHCLVALQHHPSLEHLSLYCAESDPRDLELLARLPMLRSLGLHGSAFTDGHLSNLVFLRDRLERLSLGTSAITGNSLGELQNWQLTTLDLSGTVLVDACLSRLPVLPKLEKLDLSGTHITLEGIKHLADFPSLQELKICDTGVTARELAAAQQILPHCKLTIRYEFVCGGAWVEVGSVR